MQTRRRTVRWLSTLAATLLLGTVASAAQAQETGQTDKGFALDRFQPSFAGDRLFGVQSPYSAGHLEVHASLLLNYALNPLVLVKTQDGAEQERQGIVSHQMFTHINGTFSLFNRVALNLDIPIALVQSGDSPTGEGQTFTSPSGADFGDLRVGVRGTLYGDYFDIFQAGVGGYLWLPTGTGDFVSDGSVRGALNVLLGGRAERFVWSFSVGSEIRGSKNYLGQIEQGTLIQFGGGIGFLLDDERNFQIGPEISGALLPQNVSANTTNMEALLGMRYRFMDDFEANLGLGGGLAPGVGTPTFRALLGVAYTPQQKKAQPDRDKDDIIDAEDICPDVHKGKFPDPDPKRLGCPADRDGDKIIDEVDACPDQPGVPSEDPKKHGCPLPNDRDKDGIIDPQDACPDVPGVKNADPKKNGCPPDRDNDGILDAQDACPDKWGVSDPDPKKHGCPKSVVLTENEILILQQVQFDFAKATIRPVSFGLLDEVAAVLRDHPELLKLEVQGHTDNKGQRNYNLKLSQARSDSVMAALVQRGIDPGRMIARGYGPDVPIAENTTDAGRQLNRRVQFKIIEKRKK